MRCASLLSAVLLTACAPAPRPGTAPSQPETVRIPGRGGGTTTQIDIHHTRSPSVRTFGRSADQVWAVLPAVYAELSIPITEFDATSRVIGNPSFKVRRRLGDAPLSRYLDCGSAQGSWSADSYEVLMSMETHVQRASADSTEVTTVMEARGRPVTFSADYITCGTRGALEKRFFDILAVELHR